MMTPEQYDNIDIQLETNPAILEKMLSKVEKEKRDIIEESEDIAV